MKTDGKFDKQRKSSNILTVVIAFFLMLILGLGAAYFNSPLERSENYIEKAGKNIDAYEYGKAVVNLQKAHNLFPKNEEANEIINGYLTLMLEEADMTSDEEKKREILESVASFESDNDIFSANVEQARLLITSNETEQDSGEYKARALEYSKEGDYEKAVHEYETAIAHGADEDEIKPDMELNKAYISLVELCGAPDRKGVVEYMGSEAFDEVKHYLEEKGHVEITCDRYMEISKNDGGYIVIYGSLDENRDGTASGMVSCDSTNTIYEGEWVHGLPDGYGKMIIWNKGEDIENALIISGKVSMGIWDGAVTCASKGRKDDVFTVENGKITNEGLPDGYVAGVPCFGGSDMKPDMIIQ